NIDAGPGSIGNNPFGTNDGSGHEVNPATGQPYEPNETRQADFARVVAEFWADGPNSETPPGHWNTLANSASDDIAALRFRGEGADLDRLEWDIKLYLTLNGAMHDAAVAAWGSKRYFNSPRPISMIRHLAQLGQSSDPEADRYHPDGLPLIDGAIALVTEDNVDDFQLPPGTIAVRAWAGHPVLHSDRDGVTWIDATTWVPYQLATFVTPSFPGYVSGHSAFSRAGAEVLTAFTGDAYFPGGLGSFTVPAGWLLFDDGPPEEVTLEWATYADAADQAGESRMYGGIHISADDIAGRLIGAECGRLAVEKAFALF
ncbi:MAG: vanadium-dependent haloperoxidase, partial [Acidimicrobiales bacterium]|nr:vanadium-dependent haloperoxidase [Acidimicrobiales bacterium]